MRTPENWNKKENQRHFRLLNFGAIGGAAVSRESGNVCDVVNAASFCKSFSEGILVDGC